MRELKFRAYVEESGQKHFVYIDLNNTNVDELARFHVLTNKFGVIKEQYTDLKDKNGKEIYEGDIIKAKVEGVYGVGSSSAYIGSVEWKLEAYWDELRYAFMWHVLGSKTQPDRVYDFYDKKIAEIEIIGNIHENPELLEQEDAKN